MQGSQKVLPWLLGMVLLFSGGCGSQSDGNGESSSTKNASAGPRLTYRWIPGQRFECRFEASQDVTITTQGPVVKNYVRLSQDYEVEALPKTDDGTTSVQLTFGKLQVSMKEGVESGEFDSEFNRTPATIIDGLLHKGFHQIPGVALTIRLNESLEITEIEGLAAALSSATQGLQSNFGDLIYTLYDQSLIRQLLQIIQLPKDPVQPGMAWPLQETLQFGLLGLSVLDGTANFVGEVMREGRPVHQIRFLGQVRTSDKDEASPNRRFDLQTSNFEGRTSFDPELGQYVDGMVTFELNVTPHGQDGSERIHVTHKHSDKILKVIMPEEGL